MRRSVLLVLLASAEGSNSSLRQSPVRRQGQLRPVGSAQHADHIPQAQWDDIKHTVSGRLGAVCSPDSAIASCGYDLVCRQGVCRHCTEDSQCAGGFQCNEHFGGASVCVRSTEMAWERAFSDPWEFLCSLMIFFCSMLSAAAGTGGGGMFVPLVILLSALPASGAVPLSQGMILCSSVINLVVFVAQRHPNFESQAKIDYDCVVLFVPMLSLGVTIGVLGNQISPVWMQCTLLTATLGLSLWRTGQKGIKQWKDESKRDAEKAAARAKGIKSPTPEQKVVEPVDEPSYTEEVLALTNSNSRQIGALCTVWFICLAGSFHGLNFCSIGFLVYLCCFSLVMAAATGIIYNYVIRRASKKKRSKSHQMAIDWGNSGLFKYPGIAFAAGLLGGLLGLGGGIILGPVLLEVNMHSEATQATTAAFVFLSSSIATIQFAILGSHVWHYMLWYCAIAVLATCVGQYLCDVYVRKHKRYSLITLCIAGVLLFSLLALTVVSYQQVMADLRAGTKMWFSLGRLCSSGADSSIVAPDVTPSQTWPGDLPPPVIRPGVKGFF